MFNPGAMIATALAIASLVPNGKSFISQWDIKPRPNIRSSHWAPVKITAGASNSPSAICHPRNGYVFKTSAITRSCRKSCRMNCGPTNIDMTTNIPTIAATPAPVPPPL